MLNLDVNTKIQKNIIQKGYIWNATTFNFENVEYPRSAIGN